MINERYMVAGKRLDNGEIVTGYYFCMTHLDGRHTHHFIIPIDYDLSKERTIGDIQVEIDPASVEPVAVKVKKTYCGSAFNKPVYCGECPNCGCTVASSKNYPYELKQNDYCGHCGQRIDWRGVE